MLTAAVRDLYRALGGEISISVESSTPELWENNPYLAKEFQPGRGLERIDCTYGLIQQSNRRPVHFLEGFLHDVQEKLRVPLQLTEFKGDLHLSAAERQPPRWAGSEVSGLPFWLISAGGKRDFTIKWWEARRFQAVVDHFRGRLQFVQVGAAGHFHPELDGVIDLRGKTSLRQLIQLVHHSEGVLTPVSLLMHLAAAVEMKTREERDARCESRPCVVVAGGREPPQWEAYPAHQFVHTVGALPCCSSGGCWRSRTRPLGDGSEHDQPGRLCVDVAGALPRCMDLITADDVIRRIELYLAGSASAQRSAAPALDRIQLPRRKPAAPAEKLNDGNVLSAMDAFIRAIPAYPEREFRGRGLVICAGGEQYLAGAWVAIRMLRKCGCKLPIQLWHIGEEELPPRWATAFDTLDIECCDALPLYRRHGLRWLGGWQLKSFALLRSPFREVFLLDADNVPLVDPETFFETRQFRERGAIFWPDLSRIEKTDPIWRLCGIEPRDEPAVESGQIAIDKKRCWRELNLALWFNEQSAYFYEKIHGDKDTFHLAFRKLGTNYAMPGFGVRTLKATMCQHDFRGRRSFQHRNLDKWRLDGSNLVVKNFREEEACRGFLGELRGRLGLSIAAKPPPRPGKVNGDVKVNGVVKPPARGKPAAPPVKPAGGGSQQAVVLRGPLNGHTGYGLHTAQICHDFSQAGYDVHLIPTTISERFTGIPDHIRRQIRPDRGAREWELLLHPPNVTPRRGIRTAYFTMWETTQLAPAAVASLNEAELVIVPSRWNASCFRASGVERPIHIVPLGINTEVFRYAPMDVTGPCVFGAGGRLADSDPARKRLDDVIDWFHEAFPTETDVVLSLKMFPDCPPPAISDPRIRLIQKYLSEREMAGWYRGLSCFVSGARAEGWGLMQHQALATGRPVIAPIYGGLAEYFDETIGFAVPYTITPAEGRFAGLGCWARPDGAEVVAAMRKVYADRKAAAELGRAGAKRMRALSWQHANRELASVLQDAGLLAARRRVAKPGAAV